jgi:hypothetical protein
VVVGNITRKKNSCLFFTCTPVLPGCKFSSSFYILSQPSDLLVTFKCNRKQFHWRPYQNNVICARVLFGNMAANEYVILYGCSNATTCSKILQILLMPTCELKKCPLLRNATPLNWVTRRRTCAGSIAVHLCLIIGLIV